MVRGSPASSIVTVCRGRFLICRTSDRDSPRDEAPETSSGLQTNPGGRPLRVCDTKPEALSQTQVVSQSEGLETASKPSLQSSPPEQRLTKLILMRSGRHIGDHSAEPSTIADHPHESSLRPENVPFPEGIPNSPFGAPKPIPTQIHNPQP